MDGERGFWRNTTHDWSTDVDVDHLEQVRRDPARFAPGGTVHLVLEVLAYAADEADHRGRGRAEITVFADGSVCVTDDGRGTDVRLHGRGRRVKKPVMASKDLRFFDDPGGPALPDGQPRRGMSVVAALSDWLVHTNRGGDGAWMQRYARGVPVTDLVEVAGDGTTGTAVCFHPEPSLVAGLQPSSAELHALAASLSSHLAVEVHQE